MVERRKVVNLARSTIDCRCHVCAFFDTREDEYKVLLPFIKEGLEAGDRAVQIIDKHWRTERLSHLAKTGVDIDAAERSGQLEIRDWESAYLRGGTFDQDAMLALLEDLAMTGERRGTGITRLWANMEWALGNFPGVHDIVEYESRLNRILPKYDIATVCTYDLTKFSAPLVMDILRTHPQVILGGVLRENPFYVPPEELLLELKARGAAAA
jgi:hypothetical protein